MTRSEPSLGSFCIVTLSIFSCIVQVKRKGIEERDFVGVVGFGCPASDGFSYLFEGITYWVFSYSFFAFFSEVILRVYFFLFIFFRVFKYSTCFCNRCLVMCAVTSKSVRMSVEEIFIYIYMTTFVCLCVLLCVYFYSWIWKSCQKIGRTTKNGGKKRISIIKADEIEKEQ